MVIVMSAIRAGARTQRTTTPRFASAPLAEFLAWVAARPRTYADTMEGWRTSCPRLALWEEATEAGLVRLARPRSQTRSQSGMLVLLTARGRRILEMAAERRGDRGGE